MPLSCITRPTRWSAQATTVAFSAALLTSALAGIPIGRLLDRRPEGGDDGQIRSWRAWVTLCPRERQGWQRIEPVESVAHER